MGTPIPEVIELEISRGMETGKTPAQIRDLIVGIPEVGKALAAFADRNVKLHHQTPQARALQIERLTELANWLDDGFHEGTVDQLRSIATDLSTLD